MTNSLASKGEFNNLLVEVIDKTLTSLGEEPKTSIYRYLEEAFNLKKGEIPERITDFSNGLEALFGLGALFLEIRIIQYLHEEIGLDTELLTAKSWSLQDLTLPQYVDIAKKHFEDIHRYGIETCKLLKEDEAMKKYK